MTSRERVRRSLEFDRPDRVPRHTWWLPVAEREHGAIAVQAFKTRWPDDIGAPAVPMPDVDALQQGNRYDVGIYVDEWGCAFQNLQQGIVGEVTNPLLDDWSKLESFRPPHECLAIDVDAINAVCRNDERFLLSEAAPRPFERIQFLRGTTNVYLDLADESEELRALLRRIHDHYCKEMEIWARTEVDGLRFLDDWGSQRGLLINPEVWRTWFKPLYADYIKIAHDAGKKVFMHSDGNIMDIYEDLIEIGLDAINSQIFCMDIEAIGNQYQGRITFWGEMDRQHILPFATEGETRAAVHRAATALYDPRGGMIDQFEFGAGTKLKNATATHETWDTIQ